jgi:hypothetical protein
MLRRRNSGTHNNSEHTGVLRTQCREEIWTYETEEIRGEWRKLCNQKLHNLYVSPDSTRMIEGDEMGM